MFSVGLGVGILIGSLIGVFFTALCVGANRGDNNENDKSK